MNADARFRQRFGPAALAVSAAAFVIVLGVRSFVISNIKSGWEALRPEVVASEQSLVSEMFDEKVGRLLRLAAQVRADSDLISQCASSDPESRFRAFQRLEGHRAGLEVAIDVLDSAGRVLAWSGRDAPGELARSATALRDSAVFLSRSKLHQYLSLALRHDARALWIVIRAPLELRYPISNKFVEEVSFAQEAGREIGRAVEVVLEDSEKEFPARSAVRVPLGDGRGAVLGYCLFAEPTLENVLERTNSGFLPFLALLAGIAVALGLWVSLSELRGRSPVWVEALVASVLIWAGRALMLLLDFPKALVSKELFDASRYGAPFVLGLTSSPGDTFLSSLALLGTLVVVTRAVRRSTWMPAKGAGSFAGRLRAALTVLSSMAVSLVFTRAYGASVRSFVFDSSIRYDEPSTLLPDPVALLMLGSLLALTLALILVYASMLRLFAWSLGSVRASWGRSIVPWVAFFACFALLALAYGTLLATPQVPLLLPLALAVALWLLLQRLDARSQAASGGLRAGAALVMAFLAFAFAAPVLASKIEEKTEHELLWAAKELVRPAGSWLPFVIADGLQQIIEGSDDYSTNAYGARTPSAFELWARTLMSREGYNSGVILYGPDGVESDRFSVGLTSYEQSELIQQIFELDEEMPRSFERRRPGGVVRYYGSWGTLRNERGEVTGYVALMLSALQQSFFRGEAAEKLGPLGNTGVPALRSEAAYAEYVEGLVESSNTAWLYPGRPLEPSVVARLDSLPTETFLRDEALGGEDVLMAYVADESTPGRVVAVGIEKADLRWQIFSAIRLLLVFLAISAAALAVDALRRRALYRRLFLGFRGKLLLAFLTFTVAPLLVLGYYNRAFTIERVEAGIARDLAQSLTLIERRVGDFVENEEDFTYGVTDDFCDAIATEFGVDFSVFVAGALHSSSRPELYQTEILSPRLLGTAYAAVGLLGQSYYQDVEQIGRVTYAVGYAPFKVGERTLGILSVPTLYRQAELEEELAQRNAFVISVYGIILVVVLVIGVLTANALSRPVHDLTDASRLVARGNLDVSVVPSSRDEIGELVQSFNDMVKDLKKSRQELARAERESAWKEMAKQVAHEIKNPLTPMKLSLQHLRQAVADRAPNLAEIIDRVTKTVTEQIDTLARIATEFSHFARMPERNFERCDVHALLGETVELFRHIEGLDIRTVFSDTPIVLVADRDELRRVFVNILRNSVQAMEKGGMIAVETERRGSQGVIRFRDTGAGIPEELRAKVFQPNFSTKTEGMGLGLAMSRRIVEDLNGRIELESAVGRGTTITLTIPLALGE